MKRKKKRDGALRQLAVAGWNVTRKERGHLVVTPDPLFLIKAGFARVYEVDRNDEGRWYSVFTDPKRGRCIDDRVPLGEARSLGEAVEELITHVDDADRAAQKRNDERVAQIEAAKGADQ